MKKDNWCPIYKVEEGFIKNKLGSYSLCYKIGYKNIFSLSKNDYVEINKLWQKVLSMLPDYSILHKQDVYVEEKYSPLRQEGLDDDMFAESYYKKFLEYPYLNNISFLYFIKSSKKLMKRDSIGTMLVKTSIVPQDLIDSKIEKEFYRSVKSIVSILDNSGYFEIEKIEEEEILSSEHHVGILERYNFLNFSKKHYTADIIVDETGFQVGNKYVNFYAINDLDCLPMEYNSSYDEKAYKTENTSIHFSLLYPIGLGLPCDHITNQIFFKTNKDDVLNKLRQDNKGFSSFIGGEANRINLTHNENFIEETMTHMREPIYCHINVMVWSNNKKKSNEMETMVIESFNNIGFTPNIVTVNNLNLFYSCYPGNASDFPFKDEAFLLHDIQAASLTINEGTTKSNVSNFGLRLADRLSGKPVYLDISDTPLDKGIINNKNKVIFGPSGSGKSFGCNNLVNSYIRTDSHVVIVDVGDSYERQCEYYGGYYFKYEKDNPISFNPFSVPGNDPTEDKKDSLITLILTLWKKSPEDYEKIERTLLNDAIGLYYKFLRDNEDINACFNTFYDYVTKVFFDRIKKTDSGLEKKFDMLEFETVLRPFYKNGTYDYLLNASENIDLFNKKLIVFELDNIKDNKVLFPVVTLIIMDTFINKMLNLEKGVRKVMIIEEAWKAIANEGMATFIKYLYKTCRKHNGETIMVTQEVEDLIGNEIVKNTVISQSPCKILMDMKEYVNQFDSIKEVLGLTDQAKDLILSINKNLRTNTGVYKEKFIALGNEYNVYGVDISKEEYALYTTNPMDKQKIERYKKKHRSLELAIKQFASEM